MAERIVSIEIGQRITRVCETDYKGQGNIYAFFLFETPQGVLENQMVQENEEFRQRLMDGLTANKIHTKKAVISISAMGIGSKEEIVPDVKEAKIKEYIRTNLSTFFPIDAKDYQVVFRVNGSTGEGMKRVQLYAVPNTLVQSMEDLAKFCKLTLLDIGFVENGIAESLRREYKTQTVAHISLEEQHSSITIIANGQVALARNISYGMDEAIVALQEKDCLGQDLSYLDVWEKMCQTPCIYASMAELDDGDPADTKWIATSELRYTISNINRILEYYISKHEGATFDAVLLTGLGSQCLGIKALLESEINYPLSDLPDKLIPQIPKGADASLRDVAYASTVVAKQSIGIQLLSGKRGGSDETGEGVIKARKCMILCLMLSVLLVVVPLVQKIMLTMKENQLQTSIASLAEAKQVYENYEQVKGQYEELEAMVAKTESPNDRLLTFIGEMERGMPTDVVISELTAEGVHLSIYLQAPTKRDAAKTIEVFRTFESVTDISCDALESSGDSTQDGSGKYSFTITCTYVDPETGEAMTEDDETDATDSSNSNVADTTIQEDAQ